MLDRDIFSIGQNMFGWKKKEKLTKPKEKIQT
jgi:hypothetical protein